MNSLREISNELNIKLNEIRQSIFHPSKRGKVFVLLEGETDRKLFRKLFSAKETDIVPLNGKEKIKEALKILKREGYKQVIGIKDSDFDHLENLSYKAIDLFITDYADMEIQMIESSAFKAVINEYASQECHDFFLENLKNIVYKSALYIGYLRWFNEKKFFCTKEYILKFDRLDFRQFISKEGCNLEIDVSKLINHLLECSRNTQLSESDLKQTIEELKKLSQDFLQICNGHDITKILSLLLINRIDPKSIERSLRLSYSFDYFIKTNLYKDLKEWETKSGFKLFEPILD